MGRRIRAYGTVRSKELTESRRRGRIGPDIAAPARRFRRGRHEVEKIFQAIDSPTSRSAQTWRRSPGRAAAARSPIDCRPRACAENGSKGSLPPAEPHLDSVPGALRVLGEFSPLALVAQPQASPTLEARRV